MLCHILSNSMTPPLRNLLNQQLTQLHNLENQAHTMATQRGWDIRDISVMSEYLTVRKTKKKLRFHKSDSQIAATVILSNAQTIIVLLRAEKSNIETNSTLQILSQRYLDCIHNHIRQLQQFL